MRIIENSKLSRKFDLKSYNNLSNRPTEFFNFISTLCNKYKMTIFKIAKTHSDDRNLGVQLVSLTGHAYIFFNHSKNLLEVELSGKNSRELIKDIIRYAKTNSYKKGEYVLDTFGTLYILDEDLEYTTISKKFKAIRSLDNVPCSIYNTSIVPYVGTDI